MSKNHARMLEQLKAFGLSLPDTQPKSPWPGHDDVAVHNKTFAYLSVEGGSLFVSVKLPVSRQGVLALPFAKPTGYGLGKSGWVSIEFPAAQAMAVPLETMQRWMWESYRAQAPKRLLKEMEAAQPWIKAGQLPSLPRS